MSKEIKKHPRYWKVRAAALQWDATAAARAVVDAAAKALNDAMTEAGLDPKRAYAMNDAEETITLKTD